MAFKKKKLANKDNVHLPIQKFSFIVLKILSIVHICKHVVAKVTFGFEFR